MSHASLIVTRDIEEWFFLMRSGRLTEHVSSFSRSSNPGFGASAMLCRDA